MNMEEAIRARTAMQGRNLGGQPLKINFGKDTGPPQGGGAGAHMGIQPSSSRSLPSIPLSLVIR